MKKALHRILSASLLLSGLLLASTACKSNCHPEQASGNSEINADSLWTGEQKIWIEVSYFDKEKGIMKVKLSHEIKTKSKTANADTPAVTKTEILSSPTVALEKGRVATLIVKEVYKDNNKNSVRHKFFPKAAGGDAFECEIPATNGTAMSVKIYKVADNKATLVVVYNSDSYQPNRAAKSINIIGEYEVELDKPTIIYQSETIENK